MCRPFSIEFVATMSNYGLVFIFRYCEQPKSIKNSISVVNNTSFCVAAVDSEVVLSYRTDCERPLFRELGTKPATK